MLKKDCRSKYLVYTSAGDNANVHCWLKGNERQNVSRDFDLWITYYGDQEERYRDICDFYNVRKGGKFQNLLHVYNNWKNILDQYEAIFVTDDDIIIDCSAINRLFEIREKHDLWLLQPAFKPEGKISHPITQENPDCFMRYTNFVEVTCPLFRKDKLDDFMQVYDPVLTGWGIDWWFLDVLGKKSNKIAVVDSLPCTNPLDSTKGGQREIDRLQTTSIRIEKWNDIKMRHNILTEEQGYEEFGCLENS